MSIRYKVVPLPAAVKVKKPDKGEAVANFLQEVMNEQAREGWTFVQLETLQAMEPAGCSTSSKFELVNQVLAVFMKNIGEPKKKKPNDQQANDETIPKLYRGI